MTELTIGGKSRKTAPMNIKTLRKVFPFISAAQGASNDPDKSMEALCAVISGCLARAENVEDRLTTEQVEEELLATEMPGIKEALPKILAENGFQTQGEAKAAGAQ